MRFCQSFMTELQRHIGANTDVPAGDIGVGGREIGFMFGQYKRLRNEFTGTLTGKGLDWGGSPLRPEATGYGTCYFAQEMLATRGESFKGKTVAISGSGNVAQYACEKATQLGAKVVTLSDSSGYVYDPEGIDADKLAYVMELKNIFRGRIREYAEKYPQATYYEGQRPWSMKCDIAMPCATQNELDGDEAQMVRGDVCADGDLIHADTAVCNALSSARGLEISAALDEVFLFEQLEILRDRGQAQMERVGDLLPGAAFVEIDMVENLAPVIAAHGFGCDFLHGDPPLRETRYRYACEAAVDWSRCAQIY